ncbi:MAG TPA: dinitrogenase iron-molybdenum cofactor biosynthesis protein [Firmicutes bacterium]|nr:dinitrogenase iron-molybdenum cofactor biosynthesis protein [Bacillota bacterium]
MRIAVTAQGVDLDSAMDPRFGRCRNFIIVDPESDKFDAFSNESVTASGGAGTQSAQFLANQGVDAVVTGNIGPNASRALEAAGIKVYTMAGGTVRDALQAYRAGKISTVTGATVDSHHGMGRR